MRSFITELAQIAGKTAREHFRSLGHNAPTKKGRNDYVTFVDRSIEETLSIRIRNQFPDHLIVGEETHSTKTDISNYNGPAWIIDPIDGTTNFVRGIPHFAISIAYCEQHFDPRYAVVYDPIKDEMFFSEKQAGTWLNNERVYTSNCKTLEDAIVACAAPFRSMDATEDVFSILKNLQPKIDDMRRGGSAALDLAYAAVGRCDAYWELGIWPWDTAAGELLVRGAGGTVTDVKGNTRDLLTRRSIIAAATPELHALLMDACACLQPWLDKAPYTEHLQMTADSATSAD